MQEQVRSDFICTDEYAYLFESCLRGVAQNYQKEKLEMFRGILVNSLIKKEVHENKKMYYLSLVNNLSTVHIKILKFMENPETYLSENNISEDKITGGYSEFFQIAINVELDIIKAAIGDLYDSGLILSRKDMFDIFMRDKSIQSLKNLVSDFGKSFISFCKAK